MTASALYCAGSTPAILRAAEFLNQAGVEIAAAPGPGVGHLLLDVPSFPAGKPEALPEGLPREITIWGGNLNCPSLAGYRTMDLLKDEVYLRANAAITADCALTLLSPLVTAGWKDLRVLLLGWGRIGKHLSLKLKALGCQVTVAARSDRDRTQLRHLGYSAIDPAMGAKTAKTYQLIISTVPAPVLSAAETAGADCIKMDLASVRGIEGTDVLWARGLPGRYAPERSGRLIADTVLRLWKEEQN